MANEYIGIKSMNSESKMFVLGLIAISIVSMTFSFASAEIYVWEDESGSHAVNNAKDVPPDILIKYDKSRPKVDNDLRLQDKILENDSSISLIDRSKKDSESLAKELDSYKLFLAGDPGLMAANTKYSEMEELFYRIGKNCKLMGDAEVFKRQGEYIKAVEVEGCNDRRLLLAPFMANTIVATAKYNAIKGNKSVAKKMFRDLIVRFTGINYKSQVKEAEFGLEDLNTDK